MINDESGNTGSCDNSQNETETQIKMSLQLFVKLGCVEGIELIVSELHKNPIQGGIDSQAIERAVRLEDKVVAKKIVSLLCGLYKEDSRFYLHAIRTAIKNLDTELVEILLANTSTYLKTQFLSFIIRQSNNDNESKNQAVMTLYRLCTNMGADEAFNNFTLYHQALREKSLPFIRYYAKNHPNVVKENINAFNYFCIQQDSTNEMIKVLLDAGAKITSLEPRNWVTILKNRHMTLVKKYSLSKHNCITNLISNDEFRELVPTDVLTQFIETTIPLVSKDGCKEEDQVSTLIWLLREELVDAQYVMHKFLSLSKSAASTDKEFVKFLWDYANNASTTKVIALCCILALRIGVIKDFSSLCDDDQQKAVLLLWSIRGASGVEPFELMLAMPKSAGHISTLML